MPYQLLGTADYITSPYKDGFLLFYLIGGGRGVIQQEIGETTPFKINAVQLPFKGELTTFQEETLKRYEKQLVVDSKNRVWRIVSHKKVAPPTDMFYMNKRMHEGQSNQVFGTQTNLKKTNEFDYTSNQFLGSIKSLKDRNIL